MIDDDAKSLSVCPSLRLWDSGPIPPLNSSVSSFFSSLRTFSSVSLLHSHADRQRVVELK